ncbi:MAG: ParB N-terminal domain-containing protein [bacterium]|nr:ParB N-terminal domain-containing protein [bacterium]
MEVTAWPIDQLTPHPTNPRSISDHAVQAVAELIRRYGWRQPIVADTDGVIVVGHTRFYAARLLGHDTVPVHVAAELSDEEAMGYRIGDNAANRLTDWDPALLYDTLSQMGDDYDELAKATALEKSTIEALLDPKPEGILTEATEATYWVTLSVPAEKREELDAAVARLAKRVGAEVLRR